MDEVQVKYAPDSNIFHLTLTFFGSMDEKELIEFVFLFNKEKPGKFGVAIVKADEKVVNFDKEVVVDYKKRSMKTFDPLLLRRGM